MQHPFPPKPPLQQQPQQQQKPPSRLDEARSALEAAERAGLSEQVIEMLKKERDQAEQSQKDARPIGARLDSAQAKSRKADGKLERARESLAKAKEELQIANREAEEAAFELASLQEEAARLDTGSPMEPDSHVEELQAAVETLIVATANIWLPAGTKTQEDGLPKTLSQALENAQRALSKSRSPPAKRQREAVTPQRATSEDEERRQEEEDREQTARRLKFTHEQDKDDEQEDMSDDDGEEGCTQKQHLLDIDDAGDPAASIVNGMLQRLDAVDAQYAAAARAQLRRQTPYSH